MVIELRILGKPDRVGNASVIVRRTQKEPQIADVVRTAREYVLNSRPPGVHGFSLCNEQGREFLRWFRR
jgi:hypothetical protein